MILLLCFLLITKKIFFWKKNNNVQKEGFSFISHRGYHKYSSENSIEAIKNAKEKNFKAIEIDVFPSKDNKIFCSHNIDLERKTRARGFLDEMLSKDLFKIKDRYKKSLCVPPLEAVFKKFKDNKVTWILDIKTKNIFHIKHVLKIMNLINKYKLTQATVVSSFNPLIIIFAKIIQNDIKTAFIIQKKSFFWIINFVQPDYLHLRGDIIKKKIVSYAKKRNIKVNAWTINNRRAVEWLKKIGVNGIITDNNFRFFSNV